MEERAKTRHEIRILGRYRTGSGIKREVTMLDLSETGCRFFDKYSALRRDTPITIRIESLGPFDAHVRWVDNGIVGAQFAMPIYGPVFEHIRDSLGNQSWKPAA